MYRLIRSLLWRLEPEYAHHVALSLLRVVPSAWFRQPQNKPVHVLGLEFPHPVGLAAGFDPNGTYLPLLAKLGFAFIELGCVTPKAQLGNAKPRLHRLIEKKALINRMGFCNDGVDALVRRIQQVNYSGIVGVNIGKNLHTPIHEAADDYVYCLRALYPWVSYITVNVSSPNTPNLRTLMQGDYFSRLMNQLREEQLHLADVHKTYAPMLIKLSPDESEADWVRMAETLVSIGIDGVVATNTTLARDGVLDLKNATVEGGLSGPPLFLRATTCLRVIKEAVGDALVLIGSGGIDGVDAAQEKLNAGASLLQVYTGLIYEGPSLVSRIVDALP